jgi:hypothetical protein
MLFDSFSQTTDYQFSSSRLRQTYIIPTALSSNPIHKSRWDMSQNTKDCSGKVVLERWFLFNALLRRLKASWDYPDHHSSQKIHKPSNQSNLTCALSGSMFITVA